MQEGFRCIVICLNLVTSGTFGIIPSGLVIVVMGLWFPKKIKRSSLHHEASMLLCGCGYGSLGWILAHSTHGLWKSLLLYVVGYKTKLILQLYQEIVCVTFKKVGQVIRHIILHWFI